MRILFVSLLPCSIFGLFLCCCWSDSRMLSHYDWFPSSYLKCYMSRLFIVCGASIKLDTLFFLDFSGSLRMIHSDLMCFLFLSFSFSPVQELMHVCAKPDTFSMAALLNGIAANILPCFVFSTTCVLEGCWRDSLMFYACVSTSTYRFPNGARTSELSLCLVYSFSLAVYLVYQ